MATQPPEPKVLGIIPVRYASQRFPGKPLALIAGKTLTQRTYERAAQCTDLDELIVATDDQRIFDHVKDFGGKVVMTSQNCPTGTDRLAEVLRSDLAFNDVDIVVNIQGDEPVIEPAVISEVITQLKQHPEAVMSTAACPFQSEEDVLNPSKVKCVIDLQGKALLFSRHCPAQHWNPELPIYHHVGLYCYRRTFLLDYAVMAPTPLQESESLEQLKVLENGYGIQVAIVDSPAIGVDTPEDIGKVEQLLCKQDTSLSPAASARH